MQHLVRRVALSVVVLAAAGCASGQGGGSPTSDTASVPSCQEIATRDAEAYREGLGEVPFSGTPPAAHNDDEVRQAMRKHFPKEIREAGDAAAVALVWVHVQENGQVDSVQVDQWKGDGSFDEAARSVARAMEFAPAVDEAGEAVPVWIRRCITFSVRRVD